jgi:hypothetical protein
MGGWSHAFPSVRRTSALCRGLRHVSAEPTRASGTGPEADKEMKQLNKQRKAAAECGYDFVIGVSTDAHKLALLRQNRSLQIVVTGCKR